MNYRQSKQIKKYISSAKKVIINCHKSPDLDSVGSALAMMQYLESEGCEATVVSPDHIPEVVDFLEGSEKIRVVNFENVDFSYFDLFIALDSAGFNVITGSRNVEIPKLPIVVIDHHKTNEEYGKINLVDENASSTGEMIYLLLSDWGVEIDNGIATALLTAIIGDTGAFQFPGANSRTLKVSAELIDRGTDKDEIMFNLFKKQPYSRYKTIAEILHKTKIESKYRFIYSAVDNESFKRSGGDDFARNFAASNLLPMVDESDFGIVMVETLPKKLNVSFRSRLGKIDVSSIAKEVGGGGHKLASGATIEGLPFNKAVQKVLKSARKYAAS